MSISFGWVACACVAMIMTATSVAGETQHVRAKVQNPVKSASVENVMGESTERRIDEYPPQDEDPPQDEYPPQDEDPRQDEYPRQYILWKSEDISKKVLEWKEKYPDLVHVTTSQEAYGLSRSGGANDCPFDEGGDGCLHYIVTIQDFVAHPDNSDSSSHLPEVFWSGCVHGNERVGPTSVMEAATLLLEAATCEARPQKPSSHDQIGSEISEAKSCRLELEKKGVDERHRQWLARLATTRRIVMIPTANALGYFRNKREENGIDPNRDFPIDIQDPQICMQTIAGRSINEVFREHMFQLALTYHGGTEVIGYEWGAPSYLHKWSPDDAAQAAIAHAYSNYGGGWAQSRAYDVGTMNDKVYYVRGGMEDWAYCGSWIPEIVVQCEPTTYNPYPKEKTTYNNATLRAFNMLVETSHQKIPPTNMLGNSKDVLDKDTDGNGHVSRNIRLALLSADVVEPYVSVVAVNDLALSDDVVPLMERNCDTAAKKVLIPRNVNQVSVEWSVGGALDIDETKLWVAKALSGGTIDCLSQPSLADVQAAFQAVDPNDATFGTGYFSAKGPQPHPSVSNADVEPTLGPVFSAVIDVSALKTGEKLTVIASARVDKGWATKPKANVGPDVPPQAHIVNARTNPEWDFHSAGKHIKGRLDWFSIPIDIVVGDYDDNVGQNQAGREITTIEVSNRFGGHADGGASPYHPQRTFVQEHFVLVAGFVSLCAVLLIVAVARREGGQSQFVPTDMYDDDDKEEEDTFAGSGNYSDKESNGEVEMKGYRDDPLGKPGQQDVEHYTID